MDSRKFWEVLLAKEECEDNSLLLSSSNTKKDKFFCWFLLNRAMLYYYARNDGKCQKKLQRKYMDSREFWEVLLAKEEYKDNSLLLSSSNTKKTNSFVDFYGTE